MLRCAARGHVAARPPRLPVVARRNFAVVPRSALLTQARCAAPVRATLRVLSPPNSAPRSRLFAGPPPRLLHTPALVPVRRVPRAAYATEPDDYGFVPDPVGAKLIPMVNQLQEAFISVGQQMFELPQLVVVGSQSSGKSSVIEALVGRDFLPRGTGIVTRRPLVLQLIRDNSTQDEMYGTFAHTGTRKFSDFTEIRKEIERETERVAPNKGISSEPIILRIHAPHVLPLSLVDLPGVTKVPVGSQPKDIEQQVRRLVMQYIMRQNTIILAVTPANVDPSTSDALQLAKEADPDGMRTLGVITKLDLMDKGTDATDFLAGRILPLRLGFVPVVNRSQSDIQSNKSIREMWRDERAFFRAHPAYGPFLQTSGSRYLAQRCNSLLTDHIRRTLPQLKETIYQRTKELKAQLEAYGEQAFAGESAATQGWYLLQVLNKFSAEFSEAIEGQGRTVSTSELTGGARIRYIFQEAYAKRLKGHSPLDGITLAEFRTALNNASGPRASLFVPEAAFEMLVRRQIEKLRDPSLQCAELVLQELLRIVAQLENKELVRFTLLRQRVVEIASHLMKRLLHPTSDMINKIIDCELSYINTSHPDFIGTGALSAARTSEDQAAAERDFAPTDGGSGGLFGFIFGRQSPTTAPQLPPKEVPVSTQPSSASSGVARRGMPLEEPPAALRLSSEMTPRERAQIALVKQLLSSYYGLTQKSVQDSVTKAIWHFMVDKAKNELQKELVAELYQEPLLPALLQESDEAGKKRTAITKELATLKRAKKIVQGAELAVEVETANPLRSV